MAWLAWSGSAWSGTAGLGKVWYGTAQFGGVWQGKARLARRGMAVLGEAGHGLVRRGGTRHGTVGKVRLGKAELGVERHSVVGQGAAGSGKAWRSKARNFMDWRIQEQQRYKQEQAAKREREAQEATEHNRKLKAQFEERAQQAGEQAAERARQQAIKEQQVRQQQAETAQRLADSLKLLDQQRQDRLHEAQEQAKLYQSEKKKVWMSSDGREFRSPLERAFWEAWIADSERAREIPLVPQHSIGKYRVDFAHVRTKTIIEVDGRLYHTDKYTFTHDRVRQRILEKQGWCFIRFSGDEIAHNVEGAIIEAYAIIKAR